MKKLFILGIALALFSCQKDEADHIKETYPNYYPLEIGNYWVYENYQIDPSGEETLSTRIDSIVIKRDTVINGNTYFVLEGERFPFTASRWGIIDLVRDSSGYIVNHEGLKMFAFENFTDTLVDYIKTQNTDTLYTLTYKMEQPDYQVSVPLGTFDAVNFKGTVITYHAAPNVPNPRYNNNYFAKDVGKILESWHYYMSPDIHEKRLVRYHIEE